MRRTGFTRVEIVIVLLTIGLLAALAIPSFIRAGRLSQTNICINNLRHIASAKKQWAMECKAERGANVDENQVKEYIKGGEPKCPVGDGTGDYAYNPVGTAPRCNQYDATDHPAELFPAPAP